VIVCDKCKERADIICEISLVPHALITNGQAIDAGIDTMEEFHLCINHAAEMIRSLAPAEGEA